MHNVAGMLSGSAGWRVAGAPGEAEEHEQEGADAGPFVPGIQLQLSGDSGRSCM